MKHNILYIHGFNSSPRSLKAEQTRKYLAKNFPSVGFYCPQLAVIPEHAIAQLEQIIDSHDPETTWYFIGSSLGGYFASYLAQKYTCLAVLVNPAVKPYELLHNYIGEQINPYTGQVYQVTEAYITQLKVLEKAPLKKADHKKNNYLIMVQTGDEVLNYQQAVEKYQYSRLIIEEGGDHSFINFDHHLPNISHFFHLTVLN